MSTAGRRIVHPGGTSIAWDDPDVDGTRRLLRRWADYVAEGLPPARLTAPAPDGGPGVAALAALAVAGLDVLDHDDPDAVAAAVDRGLVALLAAGRLAADGLELGTGRVTQVSVSDGGVPKHAIEAAAVGLRGLAGDRQADRVNHGRPWQAVCLWSQEVVDALAADGHPIAAGAAGDNVTIAGLDWAAMRPGVRLEVGTALLEVSLPTVPCQKNAGWFHDGDLSRITHERAPGRSRWYAWVVTPGRVQTGDRVVTRP